MPDAVEVMEELNPHAMIAFEDGQVVFIEDVRDPDGRWYRLEVRATEDGLRAIARCLSHPWGKKPHDYETSHLASDGTLCLGSGSNQNLALASMDVRTVILRARYWCIGFSVLMETGSFPQPGGANA